MWFWNRFHRFQNCPNKLSQLLFRKDSLMYIKKQIMQSRLDPFNPWGVNELKEITHKFNGPCFIAHFLQCVVFCVCGLYLAIFVKLLGWYVWAPRTLVDNKLFRCFIHNNASERTLDCLYYYELLQFWNHDRIFTWKLVELVKQ